MNGRRFQVMMGRPELTWRSVGLCLVVEEPFWEMGYQAHLVRALLPFVKLTFALYIRGPAYAQEAKMNELIDDLFGTITTMPYPYPRQLPEDLAPWHLHVVDQGHCLAVAIASMYQPGGDPAEFLVPIPVRAVLRIGYQVRDGFVVVALEYDKTLGVVGDFDADAEWR